MHCTYIRLSYIRVEVLHTQELLSDGVTSCKAKDVRHIR